jgi:hypothetical protein
MTTTIGNPPTTQGIDHQIIAVPNIYLDIKKRAQPKVAKKSVYRRYIKTMALIELCGKLNTTYGYEFSNDGSIANPSQGLTSTTFNIKDANVPHLFAMIPIKDVNGKTTGYNKRCIRSIRDVVSGGGEENVVGGIAFFNIGLSRQHEATAQEPASGSMVKLSSKICAFHILYTTQGGIGGIGRIGRIVYSNTAASLEYKMTLSDYIPS